MIIKVTVPLRKEKPPTSNQSDKHKKPWNTPKVQRGQRKKEKMNERKEWRNKKQNLLAQRKNLGKKNKKRIIQQPR